MPPKNRDPALESYIQVLTTCQYKTTLKTTLVALFLYYATEEDCSKQLKRLAEID